MRLGTLISDFKKINSRKLQSTEKKSSSSGKKVRITPPKTDYGSGSAASSEGVKWTTGAARGIEKEVEALTSPYTETDDPEEKTLVNLSDLNSEGDNDESAASREETKKSKNKSKNKVSRKDKS